MSILTLFNKFRVLLEIADGLKNVKQGIGNLMRSENNKLKKSSQRSRSRSRNRTKNHQSCVYDVFDPEEASLNSSKTSILDTLENTKKSKFSIFQKPQKRDNNNKSSASSLGPRSVSNFESASYSTISRNFSVDL